MEHSRRPFWVRVRAIQNKALLLTIVLCVLAVASVCCMDSGRTRIRLYESWHTKNRDAYREFGDLARANGWKMCIVGGDGIGILDFGHSTYGRLYSLSRRRQIRAISRFRGERVAFIECRDKAPFWRTMMDLTDFDLRVLDHDGGVTKVPLEAYILRAPMVIGDRCVVWGMGAGVYVYDIGTRTMALTPKDQDVGRMVLKIALVEGKFLVLLVGVSDPERVLVLEATEPHREISRTNGVSNMIVVGEHVVVEKGTAVVCSFSLVNEDIVAGDNGVCFLYDPGQRTTERLAAGNLLCGCGDDEFLFCLLDRGNTYKGRGRLYRYRIGARSSEVVWEPPSEDTGVERDGADKKWYDYTRLFLSPDGRFLFMPWHVPPRTHAELHLGDVLEYEVYDLKTGKKRGALLNLYEGEFFFEFLGWDTGDQAAKPAAPVM